MAFEVDIIKNKTCKEVEKIEALKMCKYTEIKKYRILKRKILINFNVIVTKIRKPS